MTTITARTMAVDLSADLPPARPIRWLDRFYADYAMAEAWALAARHAAAQGDEQQADELRNRMDQIFDRIERQLEATK